MRLGGDEFLCVLPGATAAQARERFESPAEDVGGAPPAGSVSMGIAELRYGESAHDLIERAESRSAERAHALSYGRGPRARADVSVWCPSIGDWLRQTSAPAKVMTTGKTIPIQRPA